MCYLYNGWSPGSSNSPKCIHYHTTAYKRKDPIDDFLGEDSSDELNLTKPKMKKARRDTIPKSNTVAPGRSRPDKNTKEDLDALSRDFTVYLQVWSTATTTEPKRSGRAAKTITTTSSVNKGPFKFDTSHSFTEFQSQVAATLPCRLTLLPVPEFEWKFEKEAQNAPRKKIADAAGYEALVDAIKKKRATENIVIWLHLPKPAKEENVSSIVSIIGLIFNIS